MPKEPYEYQRGALTAASEAFDRAGVHNHWTDASSQIHVPLTSGHRLVFETPHESDHPWRVSLRRGGVPSGTGKPGHDYLADSLGSMVRIGWSGDPRIITGGAFRRRSGAPLEEHGVVSHFHATPDEMPDMLGAMQRHPGVVKAIQDDQIAKRTRVDHPSDYRARAAGWRTQMPAAEPQAHQGSALLRRLREI